MAFQSQIPVYQPRGETIAQLLMRQGDIAARGAERSGEIWGRVAENLGNIGAQAYTAHREQQETSKRDAALTQWLDSGEWQASPEAALAGGIKYLGPRDGLRFAEGLMSWQKMKAAADQGLPPEEALKNLPGLARGFLATPETMRGSAWNGVRSLLVQSRLAGENDLPPEWSPDLLPAVQSYAQMDQKPPEAEKPIVMGNQLVRPTATGAQVLHEVEREAKPPATQNIGGRVMQFNPESGRFDIPLGASEAALNREAAGAARAVASEERAAAAAEKKVEKEREALAAKRATDSQVEAAFAAMDSALAEVKKYARTGAVTSPLAAANARQQYDDAAKAFAATLSRATGDTRISDLDRKAYANLLAYSGLGTTAIKVLRPDLVESRLAKAKGMFDAASASRDAGGSGGAPPKPAASNAEKSNLLKKYGF